MLTGTGISAANSAFAIPQSAHSTINVTNNGTISSGSVLNPAGHYPGAGGGTIATPAGILAGYDGGPFLALTPSASALRDVPRNVEKGGAALLALSL